MLTIDASVHISELSQTEPGAADSRALLSYVRQKFVPVYCPTLLSVEVAASVARIYNDTAQGLAVARTLRALTNYEWVTLDVTLAQDAARIGATYRLRGADAVYAAVAQRHNSTLVTLDKQQSERLAPIVMTQGPADALLALQALLGP